MWGIVGDCGGKIINFASDSSINRKLNIYTCDF